MTLDEFVKEWLKESPIQPPEVPYERVANNIGITLYRDGPFQVQLWTFPPHTEILDHAHPTVRSWVVWVGGDYCFRRHGKMVDRREWKYRKWRGMVTPSILLEPGDSHGASIGETGGSFLSISERISGEEPISVHLAWDGPPLDAEHAARLGR